MSMTPSPQELHMLLAAADASPHGIEVDTTSPERLRTKLYNKRREYAPSFEGLSFAVSPAEPASKLWIVKNGK